MFYTAQINDRSSLREEQGLGFYIEAIYNKCLAFISLCFSFSNIYFKSYQNDGFINMYLIDNI